MTQKIVKTIIKVSVLTLIASVVLIMGVLYEYFTSVQFAQQKNELELASLGVILNDKEYFKKLNITDYRITWIDKDGTVLFDSKINANTMENHIEREEFIEALKTGYGKSIRNSATLSEKTLYSAKRLPNGSVLRISSTQLSVFDLVMGMSQPILIILVFAIIISIILAKQVTKKAMEPINNLDLENPLSNNVYDELSPLLLRIEKQNKKIKIQMDNLNQKNKEITYVMENVSDGIIVLNKKGFVISANKKAKELLFCTENGYYLDFCRNLNYKQTVEDALEGKNSSCLLKINDVFYRIYASSTQTDSGNFAVFLFINDVTDEQKAQDMRRKFTANVSHELKTPLSSIMGSAEIIENGIVKQEDIPHFAKKIREEASRLLHLIQDIIKLSRLDEDNIVGEFSEITLFDVCKQIKEKLTEKSKQKSVSFDLICDNSKIRGLLPIIHEMIYNLCDNAITYNKENGNITVEVKENDNKVFLIVKDTGIGISKQDLPHIFERFYCADKSHSKETGGTGLGLSIVKHGAELHEAEIKVESKPSIGTTFIVEFPKKLNKKGLV